MVQREEFLKPRLRFGRHLQRRTSKREEMRDGFCTVMRAAQTRCGTFGPGPIACSIDQVVYIPLPPVCHTSIFDNKGFTGGGMGAHI
jgi:hypothetical protein